MRPDIIEAVHTEKHYLLFLPAPLWHHGRSEGTEGFQNTVITYNRVRLTRLRKVAYFPEEAAAAVACLIGQEGCRILGTSSLIQ